MINLFIDCSVIICLFLYLAFMFELNLQVFLILIITMVIFLIITRRFSLHVKKLGIERNQADNLKTNLLTELSGNWRSLIDLDATDFFIKNLGKKNKDYSEASVGISRFINLSKIFIETYFGILLALISLLLAGFGELSPAATSAAVVFVLRLFPSINRAAQSIMAINSSTGALNSLYDNFVKDAVSYIIQVEESEKYISINSFEISSCERILVRGKNISIAKNFLNLIRAPSGTGKSLFLQNLYKKMKTDGVKIAYVPQDVELFSGSVVENIYLQKDIELKKINEVKKLLKLLRFPKHKLDEILDPSFDAKNLSGGERQRILLARYYIANLDYLFFDEITSALDPESETEIFNLLEIMSKSTTIVMNTHTSRPNSSNCVEIDFQKIIL
jgi:ABC-type multidrug transport system fused ATPase/permease subunit